MKLKMSTTCFYYDKTTDSGPQQIGMDATRRNEQIPYAAEQTQLILMEESIHLLSVASISVEIRISKCNSYARMEWNWRREEISNLNLLGASLNSLVVSISWITLQLAVIQFNAGLDWGLSASQAERECARNS